MTYLDPDNPIGVPQSRHEGGLDGMIPELKMYDQAYFHILEHMEVVESYVLEHKQLIVQQNPGR